MTQNDGRMHIKMMRNYEKWWGNDQEIRHKTRSLLEGWWETKTRHAKWQFIRHDRPKSDAKRIRHVSYMLSVGIYIYIYIYIYI